MSDHASEHDGWDSADAVSPNHGPGGAGSIEAYEEDDTVVLYDARNPLAWVETTRAVTLRDHA